MHSRTIWKTKWGIVFALGLLLPISFIFIYNRQIPTSTNPIVTNQPTPALIPSPAPFTAAFLIFTNGTRRDFSEDKYHFRSDAAYITDANPAIITVEQPGITWGEFFATLPAPFQITQDCLFTGTGQKFCTSEAGTLKFYFDRKPITNILAQPIEDGQQLLVSFGAESEAQIDAQFIQIPHPSEDSLPRM